MRVLVACEESQAVCKVFRALGHEAYSCDIQPCSGGHPEWHILLAGIAWIAASRKWRAIFRAESSILDYLRNRVDYERWKKEQEAMMDEN